MVSYELIILTIKNKSIWKAYQYLVFYSKLNILLSSLNRFILISAINNLIMFYVMKKIFHVTINVPDKWFFFMKMFSIKIS